VTFRHLEAFVAVARQGGFTRAADKLCLTQPTVSGQIKELEETLGVSLFQRLPRAVVLTEAGELLLPRALGLLGSREELLERAAAYRGLLWGQLTVYASTIPGEYLLPSLLAGFKGAHPGIRITLRIHDSETVLGQVRRGEAALGVVGKPGDNGGLRFHPLWRDRIALYTGGGEDTPPQLQVRDLCRVPLVLREEGSGTRRAVEVALQPLGISLGECAVVAEFGSTTAVKQAVAAGLGAGFLSDASVAAELAAGSLRRVEVVGFAAIPRRFFAVWDPQREASPAAARFREALLAAAGEP
jgi:DNA-binding transcriptional LysR family regulator